MPVLLLVVLDGAALDAFLHDVEREVDDPVGGRGGGTHGDLEGGQRVSSIAIADFREELPGVRIQLRGDGAIAALLVRQGAVKQHARLVGRQGLQLEYERTARQRGVDEHRRVVRRGADQDDGAVLDVRQQDVLLGFVEPVDFVHEENRAHAAELVAGAVADLPDLGDVRDDAGAPDEIPLRRLGDDFGQRRLAAAGRSVEDDVRQAVRLDDAAEKFAFAEDVALADDFVQGTRTHPRGQGF